MLFQEMKIAITDTTHCRAVCDVLESLGYTSFSFSEYAVSEDGATGIVAGANGSYTDTASAPNMGKLTTLNELLAMRDDMVRQKSEQRAVTEYLDPSDWSLKFHRPTDGAVPADWIKVPDGAEALVELWCEPGYCFAKDFDEDSAVFRKRDGSWDSTRTLIFTGMSRREIYWQRATHPEELPFIDDEPKSYHEKNGNIVHGQKVTKTSDTINVDGYCFFIRPKPRERVYATLGGE